MHHTTMKRIAGELGVSITTVSKVLNNHEDIGKATRSRVLAKVEELGYQRNAVARSLSLRRTQTLGLVIPDLMHPSFAELIAAIEPVAVGRGYAVLVCQSAEDARKERHELEMLRSRQVDGIVLAPSAHPSAHVPAHASANADMLGQIAREGTSLVMIDRDEHAGVKCHRVVADDEEVGRLATAHLLETGRRAIAHLGEPPMVHAKRREKGWRDALKAGGIRASEDWIARGGVTEADGFHAMKQVLSARPRIDAVVASTDWLAIGAMKAIWSARLRVPEDIAVVGVGAITQGDMFRVPLTTVDWSRREQGRRAAELLLGSIEGEVDRPQRVVIAPRLTVRHSSGARA